MDRVHIQLHCVPINSACLSVLSESVLASRALRRSRSGPVSGPVLVRRMFQYTGIPIGRSAHSGPNSTVACVWTGRVRFYESSRILAAESEGVDALYLSRPLCTRNSPTVQPTSTMEDEKEGQVISGLEKAQNMGTLSLPRLLLVLTFLRDKWCCGCHELSYAYTTANAYPPHCDNIQRLPKDKPV